METERGWDKEIKKYFQKILSSISWGLIWLLSLLTLGIYYKLAFIGKNPIGYNIFFYSFTICSLAALIYYYLRLWRRDGKE
jgi:hypothetical protein